MRRKRLHSSKRGVALSIEMALLISASIMLALLAFYGYGKTVLKQVSSEKANVAVVKAEVWYLPSVNNRGNPGVTVTYFISNLGASKVKIVEAGIEFLQGSGYKKRRVYRDFTRGPIELEPGETRTVSVTLAYGVPGTRNIHYLRHLRPGDRVVAYVEYVAESSNARVPVGLPTLVLATG